MRSRHTTLRKALATGLVVVASAMLLAACGDDEKSTSDSKAKSAATSTEKSEEKASDAMEAVDIVDTAVNAGSFGTLVKAVQAAGLEETLRGDGPFTVFAPTDDAFAKLPAGTLEDLLKPENKQKLADILTYHVVADAAVKSTDLSDGQKVKTVQGGELTVSIDGSTVKIGDATVTSADVEASNGVIHVIDSVLLPAEK